MNWVNLSLKAAQNNVHYVLSFNKTQIIEFNCYTIKK